MRFHLWYTILSLFYIALAVFGYEWLVGHGALGSYVPVGDFFLMALAIMRLTRLFTYDRITAFVRQWFADAEQDSFLHTLGELLNCPWCTGLWFALVVVFCYFATPVAWYAILVLALASVASFFQLLANWAGWTAEVKKRQCEALSQPR